MDQDEIRGTLEDFGDGGVPGLSEASLDGDSEAFEVGWEVRVSPWKREPQAPPFSLAEVHPGMGSGARPCPARPAHSRRWERNLNVGSWLRAPIDEAS